MTDPKKAIQNLFLAHKAVLISVKSLVSSIETIGSLASKSNTDIEIQLIRENLRNLSVAVLYIKDGLINHENMDKAVLKKLIDKNEMADIKTDHSVIAKTIDRIQNDLYDLDNWSTEEMKKHVQSLDINLHHYKSVTAGHIAKENNYLKRGLSNQKQDKER